MLANTVRELWWTLREGEVPGCRSGFLVVWATMFGCLPFGFGVSFANAETGTPFLLLGEVLVWAGTFLVMLLAKDRIRQMVAPFLQQEMLLMLFGGVFIAAGAGVASALIKEDLLGALLGGAIPTLLGGAVFGYGLWRLLRSTR